MTGPEHYHAAEDLLRRAREEEDLGRAAVYAAQAQVHATLGLAAATAMNGATKDGMAEDDFSAWNTVAGVPVTY